MESLNFPRLLKFSQQLQTALNYDDLVELVRTEIVDVTGYQHAWIYVFDTERKFANCVALSAELKTRYRDFVQAIPVEGDQLLAQVLAGEGPVVIEDAFSDPRTNKLFVQQLSNRTIVNIPMVLVDCPLGCFGTGTFGEVTEVRPTTPAQLDYLVAMAGHIALAVARIQMLEERLRAAEERERIYQRLFAGQRLESLGLIAGGLAHDFNNLLHITSMNLGIILEAEEKATRDQAVAAMRTAIQHGAEHTKRLLAFARRRQTLPQTWPVNVLLEDFCQLSKPLLGGAISLVLELDQDAGSVYVDRAQIEQVLMNLLLNARDAMPTGGKIFLQTIGRAKDACVQFRDTGRGMEEEVKKQLFTPFFSTKSAAHGIGLGLASARKIIEEYAGQMHIQSQAGQGTTVSFTLPRCDVSAAKCEESAVRQDTLTSD